MKITLHIHCSGCDRPYEVLSSRKKKLRDKIIDYAVCPNCGHQKARCIFPTSDCCLECHIPFVWTHGHPVRGMCARCYQRNNGLKLIACIYKK